MLWVAAIEACRGLFGSSQVWSLAGRDGRGDASGRKDLYSSDWLEFSASSRESLPHWARVSIGLCWNRVGLVLAHLEIRVLFFTFFGH
ncbi:hypothetical protein RchiOBHm_Chr2g0106531 [Rosa chinensis]|uniref:Uncharacterized protein n=1 Tax=Rosa chinensis TaxID=74649 RepID=A0A2P6RNT7_ROSCH|nr:hypothetical protein RchiOBHm_Chr2g0106531 [Rosa chinensis]